jgi:hypothetical protein
MTAKGVLAPVAVAALVLLSAIGCGGSSDHGVKQASAKKSSAHGSEGPFVLSGGGEAGPTSGLWGDTTAGPDGTHLGCVAGRHYAYVLTYRNRSKAPVILTTARGPDPAPRIIHRAAVQFSLAAPPNSHVFVSNLHGWSTAAAAPVTIPAGHSAAVQSNFVMRHCDGIAPHRTLTVDGVVFLRYRSSGHAGQQAVAQRRARIFLTRGPTTRRCAPVPGSRRIVASDVTCEAARQTAIACHRLPHRNWGTCSAAGHAWNCTGTAPVGQPSVESCWLVPATQSFKVAWTY